MRYNFANTAFQEEGKPLVCRCERVTGMACRIEGQSPNLTQQNHKIQYRYNRELYKTRNIVERDLFHHIAVIDFHIQFRKWTAHMTMRISALLKGQIFDHKGAEVLLPDLPRAKTLIGDKGHDSDGFRAALKTQKIKPCIPPRKGQKSPATYCKDTYKRRHKVENMFARLKDWRRIATRYDRCAHTFLSAIQIACIVIFWIK